MRPPMQPELPLQLDLDAPDVLREAQRIWRTRPWFRQRFQSLEQLLADPDRKRLVLTCARNAFQVRTAALQRTKNT